MTTAKAQRKEQNITPFQAGVIYLAAGSFVGGTLLLAPIHEVFHVIGYLLSGVPASISGWAETMADRYSLLGLYAGSMGEVFVLGIFGYLAAWKKRPGGWFWIGYSAVSFVSAFGSTDFVVAERIFGYRAQAYMDVFIIGSLTLHLVGLYQALMIYVSGYKKATA